MEAAVPPKGSSRPEGRASAPAPGPGRRALDALADLAALAASAAGVPCAVINARIAGAWESVASCGEAGNGDFPFRIVIPVSDPEGRALGDLTLLNRVATPVTEAQNALLSGLARQAAALLELWPIAASRVSPLEDQFFDILELIPDPLLIHAKGMIQFANAAMIKLAGAPDADALLGKPVTGLLAPETREAAESRIEDAYEKGLPTARRGYRFRRHDGKELSLELASLAIRLGGRECRLVAVRDVSVRVEAAESLRESEERFQSFMDHSPLMAWTKDEDGRFLYANRGLREYLGATDSQTDFSSLIESFPEPLRRRVAESDRQVLEQGKSFSGLERFAGPDGVPRSWWVSKFPFKGRHGQKLVGGIGLDVTDKERAEARTRVFADIFRNIQVGVYVWKLEGPADRASFRLLATNTAAAQMAAVSLDALVGKTMQEAFPAIHATGLPSKCARVLATGEPMDLGDTPCGPPGSVYTAKLIPLPNDTVAVIFDNVTEERKSREELRGSEERHRLLFQNNPQPMWLFDPGSLKFLDVNEAALARYGYTRAEFLDLYLHDIWLPEDRPLLRAAMDELMLKRAIGGVRRHRRKDGTLLHAEVYHHCIAIPSGNAVIALVNDITDKLETLERLRHSEERYRTLAAISPVGLYRVDLNGCWTYANEHMCRLLGLKLEDMPGTQAIDTLHPDDHVWVTECWNAAAAAGKPFRAEYRMLPRDGRSLWVMGNALADKAADGTPIGFVGTITDITERKQAEILLACQKRTLALIASGLPLQAVLESLVQTVEKESAGGMGAVLLADGPGGVLSWTASSALPHAFRSLWGPVVPGPAGGPLGLAAERKEYAFSPDLEAGACGPGAEAAAGKGLRACAARPIKGTRGEVLGVFAFFYPQPGEPPEYDGRLMEAASDLAAIAIERQRQDEVERRNQELREQNLRILEASRMKSEFLANMSHELRTPLNAIIGFSQLLIDRKVGPMNEKQSEYMGDILDGGMHLLRLINDVLDLAKIEAGKMQLHREEMSVGQAMREVCDILVPMAMGKHVTVRHEAAPGADEACLDGRKVRQVLYNLVSNAIKFSRQGGRVEVRSRSDGRGGILLQVADHGIGIRNEDIGKLFQQFQQLDSGSARHYPGTGLGLVITKKLVELHGGEVSVESEPGVGSVFTAHFPAPGPGEE